jgi:hypothetical protein
MRYLIELAPLIGGILELAAAAVGALDTIRDRRRQR